MLTLLTGSASAETFTARVIGVTDGDTITVLRVSRPEVIRLRGIDAPERGQAYGERAKQYVAVLAFGKMVAVEAAGRDRYDRLIAEVHLPDGRSLNEELIRAGLAWWFRRYSPNVRLAALETEARAARAGLWAESRPVPPWEWRRMRTGKSQAGSPRHRRRRDVLCRRAGDSGPGGQPPASRLRQGGGPRGDLPNLGGA